MDELAFPWHVLGVGFVMGNVTAVVLLIAIVNVLFVKMSTKKPLLEQRAAESPPRDRSSGSFGSLAYTSLSADESGAWLRHLLKFGLEYLQETCNLSAKCQEMLQDALGEKLPFYLIPPTITQAAINTSDFSVLSFRSFRSECLEALKVEFLIKWHNVCTFQINSGLLCAVLGEEIRMEFPASLTLTLASLCANVAVEWTKDGLVSVGFLDDADLRCELQCQSSIGYRVPLVNLSKVHDYLKEKARELLGQFLVHPNRLSFSLRSDQ